MSLRHRIVLRPGWHWNVLDDKNMTTTPEQIDLWRSVRSETQILEFKEAKIQFDNKKLYKYCVAIANEGGGYLLLGIADEPPRKVVGSQAFNNPVEMAAKLFNAIGFRVDIEEVQHSDGRVVIFHIPSRPKGTAYHFAGSYLMRSGEELMSMSEDKLRKIFSEGQSSWLEGVVKNSCRVRILFSYLIHNPFLSC